MEGNNVTGTLCLKKPWPGIARTIYGSHEKYMNTYFKQVPGYYYTGDRVQRSGLIHHITLDVFFSAFTLLFLLYRDASGFYHITGRLDDVMKTSSQQLSTLEVEDVLA